MTDTVKDTYIIRRGNADNLIGHCLNLRKSSQLIDCQLQKENNCFDKVTFSKYHVAQNKQHPYDFAIFSALQDSL